MCSDKTSYSPYLFYRKLPICILFLLPSLCFSQTNSNKQNQIDSLKQIIKKANHDTTNFDAKLQWDSIIYLEDSIRSVTLMQEIVQRCNEVLNQQKIDNQTKTTYLSYLEKGLFNIGNTLFHHNNWEESKIYFDSSLQVTLELGKPDIYSDHLLIIGRRCYHKKEVELAISYIKSSIENSKEINYQKGIIDAYHILGHIHSSKGDINTAMEYFQNKLEIAKEIEDMHTYQQAYQDIGDLYQNEGNFAKASECYHNSMKICEGIGYMEGIASALDMIGGLYHEQRKYDEAVKFFKRSYDISKEINFKRGILSGCNSLGGFYTVKRNFPLALEYLNTGLVYAKEMGNMSLAAVLSHNIGLLHRDMNQLDSALIYVHKGLKINKDIGDISTISHSYLDIGYIHYLKKEHDKAQYYGNKSYLLADRAKNLRVINDAAHLLYSSYKETNNSSLALKMFEIHIAARDTIMSENNQQEMLRQEYQYEYEKKAVTDSIKYEQGQKLSKARFNAQRQRYYFVIGGFTFSAFLSGLLIYFYIQLRKANHKTQQQASLIEQTNKELSVSLEHQMALQGEIHHRVKNNLQVIISLLELQQEDIKDENAQQILESMSNRIFSMSAIHDILYHKEGITEVQLSEYVENLCAHFGDFSNKAERPIFHINLGEYTFNLETSVPLGIIITELITNSLKYGRIQGQQLEISIDIELEGESFYITYQDNGNGFPEGILKEREGGLGSYLLHSMSRQLQGRISTQNKNGAKSIIYFRRKV